ncbi:MAG: helix-turn-helix domain-containing protein [Xanthobacteraceae bacterium]
MTKSRGIRDTDYRRLAVFRHALRRFLAFSEAAARRAGITPQQHQALLAIKGAPDPAAVTVGDLAKLLLLRPHSAAELVDRMVRSRLLIKSAGGNDRRRVVLSLTPAAERTLRALSAAHIRELRQSAPVLDGLIDLLKPDGPKPRPRR